MVTGAGDPEAVSVEQGDILFDGGDNIGVPVVAGRQSDVVAGSGIAVYGPEAIGKVRAGLVRGEGVVAEIRRSTKLYPP